jgi:hypothetical protein
MVCTDTDESFCTRGSPLAGALSNGNWVRCAQKLEIGEVWRYVVLLHGSAADTGRITSVDCVFG